MAVDVKKTGTIDLAMYSVCPLKNMKFAVTTRQGEFGILRMLWKMNGHSRCEKMEAQEKWVHDNDIPVFDTEEEAQAHADLLNALESL